MTTTLTFVAHQDDDLIFMNPDVASDEQAVYNVWVVYLTAGQDNRGMDYADQRIQGARAAHARAANMPNEWTYEALQFAGHEVATNTLNGTNIRLVFTYILAASGAAGDPDGDLKRMWFDSTFEAQPIDGRAAYTRSSLLAMINAVISTANPDYLRTQDATAYVVDEHVDHIAGALFVAEANTSSNRTVIRRDEYDGYVIRDMPPNVNDTWAKEKREIFEQYLQYDPDAAGWLDCCDRQYLRETYNSGDVWMPRPYDFSGGLFTDAEGWDQPQYYTTMQTAVLNNLPLLLARGKGDTGLLLYQWDDSAKQFELLSSTGLFTDAEGWDQPQYYTTIQTAVLNNQLLLLARGKGDTGLLLYQWDGTTKQFELLSSTGLFTDAGGWDQPQYYTTIQTAVFNNQLMLLARGGGDVGLLLYQWDGTTNRFW